MMIILRFFLIIVTILSMCMSCKPGINKDLAEVYRTQLKTQNDEIMAKSISCNHLADEVEKKFQRLAELSKSKLPAESMLALINKYEETETQLKMCNQQLKQMREKRQELKIRTIKDFGKLPEWWEDPDNLNEENRLGESNQLSK